VFPLVSFTGDKSKMGAFVAPSWMRSLAWVVAVIIAALNVWLLYTIFTA
jgi:manganese transport protein